MCHTVLRRCYDCGNYDRAFEQCGIDKAAVYVNDAVNPKELSKSFRCPEYKPKFEAKARRLTVIAG